MPTAWRSTRSAGCPGTTSKRSLTRCPADQDSPADPVAARGSADFPGFAGSPETHEALAVAHRACEAGQAWVLQELARAPGARRFSVAGTQGHHLDHLLSVWLALGRTATEFDPVYRRFCAWKGVVFRHAARLGRVLVEREQLDPESRRLHAVLADLDGQLSKLTYAEEISDPAAHVARLEKLSAEQRDVETELLGRLGIEPEREATDGEELSRLLPDRTAVLDFVVHQPHRPAIFEDGQLVRGRGGNDPRVVCFVTVAGRKGPTFVDLGEARPLQLAVEAYLDRIAPGLRGKAPAVEEEDPGEPLMRLLFDPLAAELRGVRRLVVIPDAFLGELPFGALPVGAGHYLLEACDVVYASDPVTLRDRLEQESSQWPDTPSILAVGGVDYDQRAAVPEVLASAQSLALAASRGGDQGFSRHFGALDGTEEEIRALAGQARSAFGPVGKTVMLSGKEATEEAVKANCSRCVVLHLATHGFFERGGLQSLWEAALNRAHQADDPPGVGMLMHDPTDPAGAADPFAGQRALDGVEPGLLAGLVLAGANQSPAPDRDDGVLTAAEVARLDLSACRLAVLSACQSSLGTGRSGEGLQSLRRAFEEAGARTVVATLWKVDDAQTQRLMHAFYDRLWKQGLSPGDALWRARLELLRDPRTRHPRYWAAFTLSGEWR